MTKVLAALAFLLAAFLLALLGFTLAHRDGFIDGKVCVFLSPVMGALGGYLLHASNPLESLLEQFFPVKLHLALALLFCSPCWAIEIPSECRVKNVGGRCAWANVSTMGRLLQNEQMAKVLKVRIGDEKNPASTDDAATQEQVLAEAKKYAQVERKTLGTHDWKWLTANAKAHGVIATVRPGTIWCHKQPLTVYHSIIITDVSDTQVTFYCPNHPGSLWTASRAWAEAAWCGDGIVCKK